MTRYLFDNVDLSDLDIAVLDQLGATYDFDECDDLILDEDTKEELRTCARHGASGGISGFIYYSDTVAFTERNRVDIKLALEEAISAGLFEDARTPVDAVVRFCCFNNATEDDKVAIQEAAIHALYIGGAPEEDELGADWYTQVANALAWYAVEELAAKLDNAICEELDDEDEDETTEDSNN